MTQHLDALATWKQANGGNAGLASKLNERNPERRLTPQAISQWRQVPADRVLDVEAVTGISKHKLRSDVFGEKADAA